MQYVFSQPSPPLGDFVERFWEIKDAPPHRRERIIPSGTLEFVINLQEDEFRIYEPPQLDPPCKQLSGAIVSGTYQRAFVIDAQQHVSVIGVHFRPGGAFPFLGVAASELADTHLDLELLWGGAASELREQLCGAREPRERFRLLEKALMAHLFRPMEHHYAVGSSLAVIADGGPNLAMRDMAKAIGLSQRRFIEVFVREVGLTPKLFCRLKRFQRAFDSLRRAPTPDWSALVSDCGYFDQSHFIRDFRNFSGLQPTKCALERSDNVMENHIPVPTG